jgi:stage II sporulation protein D
MLIAIGGCVPPEKPARRRLIRVALLEGVGSVGISSQKTLTIKDVASGRVLSRTENRRTATVSVTSEAMAVAGKPLSARELLVSSASNSLSVNGKTYPGSLRILLRNNRLLVVNLVDLDAYLKAVVPSEMLPSWPEEALKAQAVVSRSFVLHHVFRNDAGHYDITAHKQVYNPDKRDPRTDRAVDATKDVVLFYRGNLLLPFFSTCCGGFTEYAANVWETKDVFPPPVECPFCREEPDYRWQARLSLNEFQKKLQSAGIASARSIAVHSRSTSGKRITALRVESGAGPSVIKINQFRLLMGPNRIRSGLFDTEVDGGSITFRGRGWGHGVGMCQRGAKVLAERGESFQGILKYYFPGARAKKISG